MNDAIEELIREIAAKHGVAISMDDPLAILITVNHRLITDFKNSTDAILISFKEELAKSSKAWSEEAKTKAELILNAALDASRESISTILNSGAEGLPETTRKALRAEFSTQITPVLNKMNRLMVITLLTSGLALLVSILSFVFILS